MAKTAPTIISATRITKGAITDLSDIMQKNISPALIILALVGLLVWAGPANSDGTSDWITGLPREPIHVKAWPGGKKVAVCFILYVEVWGFGHGPNFRPDMVARDPDVVDESFRQYAIQS